MHWQVVFHGCWLFEPSSVTARLVMTYARMHACTCSADNKQTQLVYYAAVDLLTGCTMWARMYNSKGFAYLWLARHTMIIVVAYGSNHVTNTSIWQCYLH